MPALKLTESAAVSVRPLSPAVVSVVSPSVNTWPAVVASVAVPSRVSLPPPVIESESFSAVSLPLVRVRVLVLSTLAVVRARSLPPKETVDPFVEETVPPIAAFPAVTVDASEERSPAIVRAPSASTVVPFSTAKLPVFSAPSASAEPMVSSASGAI